MHSTILGIWTTDILDACHIIKDIKNNRIRWSFDTSLCKQENCVELLRKRNKKKRKLYFNPPQMYWHSQNYLRHLDGPISWMSQYLILVLFCFAEPITHLTHRERKHRKSGLRPQRTHNKWPQSIPPNCRSVPFSQDHPSCCCNRYSPVQVNC